MDLHIHVKSFADVPLLDAQVDIKRSNNGMSIVLPREFANQKIPLLINDEIFYGKTDERGVIVVTKKNVANMLNKNGFVLVDMHAL